MGAGSGVSNHVRTTDISVQPADMRVREASFGHALAGTPIRILVAGKLTIWVGEAGCLFASLISPLLLRRLAKRDAGVQQ